MKGKGKGGGDKSDKEKSGGSGENSRDVVLQLSDLRAVDHVKLCPRYSTGTVCVCVCVCVVRV